MNQKIYIFYCLLLNSSLIFAEHEPTRACANDITTSCTITQSGNYRLANDITGPIVIAADNVYLSLENYAISSNNYGIIIENQENIQITNGIIQNNSQAGIFVVSCTHISLESIDFLSNVTALFVQESVEIIIQESLFTKNTSDAIIFLQSTNNVTIKKAQAIWNIISQSGACIYCNQTNNITIDTLYANNNTANNDSTILRSAMAEDISIINSYFDNNVGSDLITEFDDCSNIELKNCQMFDNITDLGIMLFLTTTGISIDDVKISSNVCQSYVLNSYDCHDFRVENTTIRENVSLTCCEHTDSNNIIYQNCKLLSNQATNILQFSNGTNNTINGCELNSNASPTTLNAILYEAIENSATINSLIYSNKATNACTGILFDDCTNCTMQNNIVSNNVGSSSTGIQINDAGGNLSTTAFSNTCMGHTTNYVVNPGSIFLTAYDRSAGTFNPTPSPHTNQHNVSAI
jgi:hypothetical protein